MDITTLVQNTVFAAKIDDEENKKYYDKPESILRTKDSTVEQRDIALTEMPELILKLNGPTEHDFLTAVKVNGMLLGKLKEPSDKVINESLLQNGMAIKFIPEPTDAQIKTAILSDPMCIEYIKGLKDVHKALALRINGLAIQLIDNPDEELQLAAVKEHPSAIYFIKTPTDKVKKFAVEQDGLVIECIKEADEELQLLAIENSDHGFAYRYIDNPSDKVSEAAYRKNKKLLPHLKSYTKYVQINALLADKENIKYMDTLEVDAQQVLLRYLGQSPHIFDTVKNIDPKILEEILKELKFKEKADKRMRIPEGLNLPQLRLYRYLQAKKVKEVAKTDLRKEDWVDERIKEIVDAEKGLYITLDHVLEFKHKKIDTDLGSFVYKKCDIARIENKNPELEIFDEPSTYFVLYVNALKLLNIEFDKEQIVKITNSLADKKQPYIPNQFVLGYVRYTNYKQEIWIDELWIDKDLKSHEEPMTFMPQLLLAKFIREMRFRDINNFYAPDANLRKRFYGDDKDNSELFESAYFKLALVKNFHAMVDGKEAFVLN